MEKVKQTTLILGEGITEFFFLDSLKDEYRELRQVKPSTAPVFQEKRWKP